MAAPLVSIIVPTRDRLGLLSRAVASLQAQTVTDFEAIIVDNSSEESTRPSAQTIPALADPRFRIVRAALARNAAGARNVGLVAAGGQWITFLDDDDTYRPEKLARQLALAEATHSPFVLCGGCFRLRGRERVRHIQTSPLSGDALLNEAGFGTPSMFHRRVREVQFDESLDAGEDLHYGQQLLAHFGLQELPVVPEPLVDVYQDGPVRPRTNLQAQASWRAARRVWWQFGARYSPAARRLFVLRARMAHAKARGESREVIRLVPALLRAGGAAQWRFAANALAVSTGWMRGRWVT